MRVAILIPNFSTADGGARHAELHIKQLVQAGHDVAVFALGADIKPRGADLFVMGMPKSLFLERVYRLFFPLDIFKTIRWLPKLKKFDLVFVYLYPLTWLGYLAKKLYKVNYAFRYSGIMDPKLMPRLYERIYIKVQILLTRLTVRNVDYAVSVSKFAQVELKKYTGLESQIEHDEIDTSRFHKGVDGTIIREKYNLGNTPVILSVGAIRPVKGVHLLIEAFNLVKQTIPEAKLLIVGRHDYGYYSKQLQEMGKGGVIFTGFVPDEELSHYYAACNLYATCSFWECCNRCALEAQACGKPVIAWHESFAEILNENSLLVEPENTEKFAQACIEKLGEIRGAV